MSSGFLVYCAVSYFQHGVDISQADIPCVHPDSVSEDFLWLSLGWRASRQDYYPRVNPQAEKQIPRIY